MHDCRQVRDQLMLLAYGELAADAAAACQAHADGCAACRAELAALAAARRALDRVPHHEAQVDLAEVCLRLAQQQRRDRHRRRVLAVASLAASVVLVVAAAQWVQFEKRPGRLIVAWGVEEPRPVVPRPVVVVDGHRPAAPAPDFVVRVAAPARVAWEPPQAGAGEYLRIRDLVLARGVDALEHRGPRAADGERRSTSYGDLRREFFEKPRDATTPELVPGA